MAEVTTYTCDAAATNGDDDCADCPNDVTVSILLGFPGRGAPHDEREVELELDLCDEHVAAWREYFRPSVPDEAPAANGGPARDLTCKACGYGPTTGAGLSAHQRATGHKGRA
jgi:hypothetical protein